MQKLGQALSRMWPFPPNNPNLNTSSTSHPPRHQHLQPEHKYQVQQGQPEPPAQYHDGGISGVTNTTECIKANINAYFGEGTGHSAAAFYNHLYMVQRSGHPNLSLQQSGGSSGSREGQFSGKRPRQRSEGEARQHAGNKKVFNEYERKHQDTPDSRNPPVNESTSSFTQQKRGSLSDEFMRTGSWTSSSGDSNSKPYYSQPNPQMHSYRKDATPAGKRAVNSTFLRNRPWDTTNIGREIAEKGAKRGYLEFSVASYNILAQNLMEDHMELYNRTDRYYLSWEYRRENLVHEISEANPDVLCLQEVNAMHFEEYFKPRLNDLGYTGIFKKRTGTMLDGCVTCFKRDMFELDTTSAVEYLHPGVHVLDRDNIGLILLLKPLKKKNRGQKLCIANTHLLFNPRRGDVKLAQLVKLFCEIDRVSYKCPSRPWRPNYHPVILCGDFNSEPHSKLYKFLCRGSLIYEGQLCKDISGQTEDRTSSRMTRLPKGFIPKYLGMTDQCQYVDVFKNRSDEYSEHLEDKRKRLIEKLKEENDKESENSDQEEETADVINSPSRDGEEGTHSVSASPRPSTSTDDYPAITSASQEKDQLDISTKSTRSNYTQGSGKISHKINLMSTYKHEVHTGKKTEREVTTCHGKAYCTVDYIMYSVQKKQTSTRNGRLCVGKFKEGRLRLLATKKLLTDRDNCPSLPNESVSSDHIMLMAKFLLKLK